MSIYLSEKKLPDTYQQVEYLSNSGTQYIKTNYVPTNDCGFEIKWRDLVENAGVTGAGSNYVMGSRNGTGGDIYFAVSGATNTQTITLTRTGVTSPQYYRRYGYEYICKGTFRSNEDNSGELLNLTTGNRITGTQNSSLNATATVYLFALNGTNIHAKVAIYYAKFYNGNGELINYFIPCYRKSDNVMGMYDLVNRRFYQNAGTRTFTKGKDVNNERVNIKVLKANDNSYTIKKINAYVLKNESGTYKKIKL